MWCLPWNRGDWTLRLRLRLLLPVAVGAAITAPAFLDCALVLGGLLSGWMSVPDAFLALLAVLPAFSRALTNHARRKRNGPVRTERMSGCQGPESLPHQRPRATGQSRHPHARESPWRWRRNQLVRCNHTLCFSNTHTHSHPRPHIPNCLRW